jgi:ketosteroid isomerase-like protein
MKKISFLWVMCLLVLLASCDQKAGNKENGGTTSSNTAAEKAKANNRAVLEAIQKGDVSKIDQYMTTDAVDHSGPDGMTEVKGSDQIKQALGSIKASFSELKMDVVEEAASDDHLFVLVKMSGTTTANPGMGMPPNQKIEMTTVDLLKFNNDGKLTDHWSYNDPKDMMKMMGGQGQGQQGGAKTDTAR